ncbi:RagB/SusD family nutrient uptake outer membrane protein [Sphingobacterium sp. LRF_L2]|uniref:RagB/SusD family nutrient uptake outer membrane protein n=1 Tax=Sphingobacterium sp. LRF_L2 TaxID=3369421 RepID=UPI003F63D7C2
MKRFVWMLCFLLLNGCTKDFLGLKKDRAMVVPTQLKDFLAMLDYETLMNSGAGYTLSEMSTDDYFIDAGRWTALSNLTYKNAYVWSGDIFQGDQSYDWNCGYSRVLVANVVLDGLEDLQVSGTERNEYDYVKACALFHRSYAFYLLVTQFCGQYENDTAGELPGIPLKLSALVDETVARGRLSDSYTKITEDLLAADSMFGDDTGIVAKTRPSKLSVCALLSRIYLLMGDYGRSVEYGETVLDAYDKLMDYNSVGISDNFPFNKYNDEVLFLDVMASTTPLTQTRLQIDTLLLSAYHSDDLRKTAFFRKNGTNTTFKGSYGGTSAFFIGLSVPEIYLNIAEGYARMGKMDQARLYILRLMEARYLGSTDPVSLLPADDGLLDFILGERRKEMVFRGMRWNDLKRLNKEDGRRKTLYRNIGGELYVLEPNSPNYVFPIPDNAVVLGGYEQNVRY